MTEVPGTSVMGFRMVREGGHDRGAWHQCQG